MLATVLLPANPENPSAAASAPPDAGYGEDATPGAGGSLPGFLVRLGALLAAAVAVLAVAAGMLASIPG
ncbi:MAG TPA: hypothetical protein VF453_14320 [Burkholderiaceae bacterium]